MNKIRKYVPPLLVWGLGGVLIKVLFFADNNLKPKLQLPDLEPTILSKSIKERRDFVVPLAREYQEELQRTVERPLFSAKRRQPVLKIVSEPKIFSEPIEKNDEPLAEKASPIRPEIAYIGYIRDNDETRALLQSQKTLEEDWVSIGDKFHTWQVENISALLVELKHDEYKYDIEISQ